MDIETTYIIVEKIVEQRGKAAAVANELCYFLSLWRNEEVKEEPNEVTIQLYKDSIRKLVADEFLASLDEASKNELVECRQTVYQLGREIDDSLIGWKITSWGADKHVGYGEEETIEKTIPREYEKGFIISEGADVETKIFVKTNEDKLSKIAGVLDRIDEIITKGYQPASGIPSEYIEQLIGYLGYRRIGDTYEKRSAQYKKKIG